LRIHQSTAQVTAPATAQASQRRERVGARFMLDSARDTLKPSVARAAIPLANMDAVLALQGDQEDAGQRRRNRSAKRGRDILDALDGLKVAILGGRVGPAEVSRILNRLRENFGPSGDPRLDQLMAEIELRAEVELAKLAVAGLTV
jgi:hypothetical protein